MKYEFNGVELKIGQVWEDPSNGDEGIVVSLSTEGYANIKIVKTLREYFGIVGDIVPLYETGWKLKVEAPIKPKTTKRYIVLGASERGCFHHTNGVYVTKPTTRKSIIGLAEVYKPCGLIEIEVDASTGELVSANAEGSTPTEVQQVNYSGLQGRSDAWSSVWNTMQDEYPEFLFKEGTGLDNMLEAIKELADKAKKYDALKEQVKSLLE